MNVRGPLQHSNLHTPSRMTELVTIKHYVPYLVASYQCCHIYTAVYHFYVTE